MCSHINTSPVHRAHITPRNTGLIGGSRHLELSILSSRTCTELSEHKWSVYYMSDSPCVSVCAGVPWCVFVSICVWKPLFTEPVGSCDKQKKKKRECRNSAVVLCGDLLIAVGLSSCDTYTHNAATHVCTHIWNRVNHSRSYHISHIVFTPYSR